MVTTIEIPRWKSSVRELLVAAMITKSLRVYSLQLVQVLGVMGNHCQLLHGVDCWKLFRTYSNLGIAKMLGLLRPWLTCLTDCCWSTLDSCWDRLSS